MENTIKKGNSADFFLNLLVFGTLYATAVSFIALWFQYIEFWLPEPDFYGAHYYGYNSGLAQSISWMTAVLVVVFPAFLLASWYLRKQFDKNPERREVKLRRWLLHATLFVAGVTVIVDLVILVAFFFNGGLTLSFFFKILIALGIAAAIFAYYRSESKSGSSNPQKAKLATWITVVVVIASIVLSFILIGGPTTQRNRRFDERRINDLQSIQNQILNYWMTSNKLPQDISELGDFSYPYEDIRQTDPQTGQPYEYRILRTDPPTYELCAIFKTSSSFGYRFGGGIYKTPVTPPGYPGDMIVETWEHGEGRTCFVLKIDPMLYKKPLL